MSIVLSVGLSFRFAGNRCAAKSALRSIRVSMTAMTWLLRRVLVVTGVLSRHETIAGDAPKEAEPMCASYGSGTSARSTSAAGSVASSTARAIRQEADGGATFGG